MSTTDPRSAWRRVEAVIDAALDEGLDLAFPLDDAVRARVRELADGDPALYREALDLLGHMGVEGDLVDTPLIAVAPGLLDDLGSADRDAGTAVSEASDHRAAGRRIDRYRLVSLLGRGGMGVVYLAERADEEFEKRVALKLLPRGFETPEALRRFRTERQILARLEHPGIARLLDGGVTADGSPYLVMELVDGEPIDAWCERNDLPVRERIRLFLQVCDAVRYAHRNLVVHRDLKPANCLVTGDGRVRLLDFGIGKVLEDDVVGGATVLQPMTPDYASPEQLANRPVSTASDVYSLGLLLYRLLTGTVPFPLGGRTPDDVRREVETRDPPLPSSRLDRDVAREGDSPRRRRLRRELRGDLDVIVLQALRRDPDERYGSVAELQADLERHLAGHPIHARPVTRWQRVRKFVGRHRIGVAVAAAVSLLLVSGAVAMILQGREAARERDRARVEAARAQRVVRLLTGLLQASGADAVGSGERTARELLDEAEGRIRSQLASDPVVLASMLEVMATSYLSFGDSARARELAEEAVALLDERAPADGIALAEARTTLANVRWSAGDHEGLEETLRSALDTLRADGAGASLAAARAHRGLGRLLARSGENEEAVEHTRRSLELFEAEGEWTEAAIDKTGLALALNGQGRREEALRLNEEALAVFEEVYGAGHPTAASTRNNMANALTSLGRHDEAAQIYRDSYRAGIEVFGEESPRVARVQSNLARSLLVQGQLDEAVGHARRAVEIFEGTLPRDHPAHVGARMNLAATELARGDVGRAVALYREGLEHFTAVMGPGSLSTERVRSLLGTALLDAGEVDAAEDHLERALAVQRDALDEPPHLALGESLLGLAQVRARQGRCDDARRLLGEASPNLPDGLPPAAPIEGRRRAVASACLAEDGDVER